MSERWPAYAEHILDASEKLRRIQQRGDLTQDEVLYDAALRNLQTLSEATQRLPEGLKRQYASIPWQQISGFRNILVHNYLGDVDPLTIVSVLEHYVPQLESVVSEMLSHSSREQE